MGQIATPATRRKIRSKIQANKSPWYRNTGNAGEQVSLGGLGPFVIAGRCDREEVLEALGACHKSQKA